MGKTLISYRYVRINMTCMVFSWFLTILVKQYIDTVKKDFVQCAKNVILRKDIYIR